MTTTLNDEQRRQCLLCPWCRDWPSTIRHTDGYKYAALACCCVGPEVRTDYLDLNDATPAAVRAWNDRQTPIIKHVCGRYPTIETLPNNDSQLTCDECYDVPVAAHVQASGKNLQNAIDEWNGQQLEFHNND